SSTTSQGYFLQSMRRIFADSPLASVHHATTMRYKVSIMYFISPRTRSNSVSAVFGLPEMS
ncbi:hypothetical protein HDZ31DRAFT_27274, partial [Schizophyllum fasciatum]